MDENRTGNEDRVYILPPTRRDGEATSQVLGRLGIHCTVCADSLELSEQIRIGVGALILTDALASDPQSASIITALNEQPTWSDVPAILLCRVDRKATAVEELGAALTNVTVLDRPTSTRTLASAVMAALRGRRRQYQLRDQINALQEARDALRAADQRKDEFLAMLAHELRNPLAPIQNAAEILRRTVSAESAGRPAVEVVKRQVSHLTRLVDDLLDVSRITQGRIQLQKRPLDLHSIIVQALESAEPLIAQKQHQVDVSSEPDRLFVEGDSARLTQCLANLLINAVKYTENGGHIRVEAKTAGSDAVVSVRDNGIGIPADLMPRIFGLFVQNSRSLDRSEGGLGIGLSVVERLMQMHGGSVTASSAGPAQGSTFQLRMPLIRVHEIGEEPAIRPQLSARRFLVVDDNVDAAESVAALLKLDGHDVRVVHTGAAALEEFHADRPDVVLLDIGLPDMNGYQVARQIRRANVAVQIIALSGYGQPSDLELGKQAGFDDHLIKPVDFDTLRTAVREQL